ncbi:BAG family molecular chaperone regulator 6-like isoform X4 [Cucurbita maxima]|uniref:BAG family molecular chaperone regulator 6-like isoform X4 n=1 Tax=Cucurbita maxima TaxID=3661 RepID=A0A6J1IPK4_CUCMA|nr:BAG family molecular chaperone regulator 6-like isoform X4 [Cucurbita maxima]
MESPFFRNHWNYHPQRPRYVPSMMEIPVHRRTVPVVPKVVSIPVRFVESKKSRSDSATKIQKVFRGFLVRKSVKKVVAIEREVNEIQRRLSNEETVDLIRKDGKERIRFGEMLMSLLFRLDSVEGVDIGIRNFRKALIKKAIALQEKVDSIAAVDEATDFVHETLEAATAKCDSEAADRSSGMNISGAREIGAEETPDLKDRIPELEDESCTAKMANSEPVDGGDDDRTEIESVEYADDCNERGNVDEVALTPRYTEKEGAIMEESTACSMESNADLEGPDADDDIPKPQVSEQGKNSPGKDEVPAEVDNDMMHREVEAAEPQVSEQGKNSPGKDEVPAEVDNDMMHREVEAAEPQVSEQGKNSPGKDEVPAEFDNDMMHREVEVAEEYAEMSDAESQTDSSNNPPNLDNVVAEYGAVDQREGSGNEEEPVDEEEEYSRVKGGEEDGESRELLEKMMVDNKRMMEMMAQLFEKNEMQSRLLSSLSHRVEQLEKALVLEMLRKKKRRNSTDFSEKCPKTKKSD